jgi:hypothetical protein
MPTVNPKISFWLGVAVIIATGIGNGYVPLDHALPDWLIDPWKSWNNLFAFCGTTVLTALHGLSSRQGGPLT